MSGGHGGDLGAAAGARFAIAVARSLVAECYGINRQQQARSAMGVLTPCWALR